MCGSELEPVCHSVDLAVHTWGLGNCFRLVFCFFERPLSQMRGPRACIIPISICLLLESTFLKPRCFSPPLSLVLGKHFVTCRAMATGKGHSRAPADTCRVLDFFFFFLSALGLCCCARAFSSCGEQGLLFVVVRGLLIAVASLVAEHGLEARKLQ